MIAALESASSDLSVALVDEEGGVVVEQAWSSAQRQSAELLPTLLDVLAREGRRLDAVTAVAVGLGPGSFTGLRVGLAIGKGLAFALGRPIVGVPSLRAWLDAHPDAAAALTRAGAREAFLLARDQAEPALVDRDQVARLIGDARVVAPAELADAFGIRGAHQPRAASAIARAARDRLAQRPEGDDLATLEPLYLRLPRGVAPPVAVGAEAV